jgi:hypothetical protein
MYQTASLLRLYYKSNKAAALEHFKVRFSALTSRTIVVISAKNRVRLRKQKANNKGYLTYEM